MRTKHVYVLIYIRIKADSGTVWRVWALWYFDYCPFKGGASFVDPSLLFVRIPNSVNNFRDMLPTIRLSPLGSPIFKPLNRFKPSSKIFY